MSTTTRLRRDLYLCVEAVGRIDGTSRVPTTLRKLTLALEDRRFYSHPGFDLISIGRAALRNAQGRHGGGASTIAQQLVRTITNRRERNVRRKVREILLAIALTALVGRERILDTYLKIAYFGYNLCGARGASEKLFSRPLEALDDVQTAAIAAMLRYPHPNHPSAEWQQRLRVRATYGITQSERPHWVRNWPTIPCSIKQSRDLSKS